MNVWGYIQYDASASVGFLDLRSPLIRKLQGAAPEIGMRVRGRANQHFLSNPSALIPQFPKIARFVEK